MAPYVPDEVDVFAIPHSRMKELVNAYVDMIKTTNFTSDLELQLLLESLLRTFMEFKTHEQIENQFIMRKLKNKLRHLSIKNSAVCNCHSDDSLSNMMHFIEDGYRKKTEQDRLNFGMQLKEALEEFTDSFLPHMKEEEEVFGPLLMQYFSYDELCELKQKVIQQHIMKEQVQLLKERAASAALEKHTFEKCEDKVKEVEAEDKATIGKNYISNLPPEIMIKILSFMSPQELGRCKQVNHEWSRLAVAPELWRNIHPTRWAHGDWSCLDPGSSDDDDSCDKTDDDNYSTFDDDVDNDGDDDTSGIDCLTNSQLMIQKEASVLTALIKHILPKAGKGVRKVVLTNNKALTNGMLNRMLQLCPNVEELDLTQTKITDMGLQRLGKCGVGCHLKKLVLSGCVNISDATLVRLAMAQHQSLKVYGQPSCHEKTIEENVVAVHRESKKTTSESKWPDRNDHQLAKSEMSCDTFGNERADSAFDVEEYVMNEVPHELIQGLNVRDCLCEAYYNECNQPIVGGCEMAITTTCKKSRHQSISAVKPAHATKLSPIQRLTDRGEKWNPEHMKKDPDYDLDSSMISKYTAAENGISNNSSMNEGKIAVDSGGKMWSGNGDFEMGDNDRNSFELNNVKECHPSCGDFERTKHFEIDAIEECVPNVLKLTRSGGEGYCDYVTGKPEFKLEHLNLSGCFQVTDVGLRALVKIGNYPGLKYLDLSGCLRLSAEGISDLVEVCPHLGDGELFYCDNIDGPLEDTAGGCRNLECSSRVCCRSGQ